MPCYKPLDAFWKRGGGITFSHAESNGSALRLPCGRCIGCRVDRKREWALRLCHEAKLHSESCFITLTYNPESLPRGATLVKRHAQLFMKRLRKHVEPRKIRYFLVGEYGDEKGRPHYHVIVYGYWPRDARPYSTGAYPLYTSESLASLWPDGFHTFGVVEPGCCLYVGGYAVKKIGGDMAKEHYMRITQDGEMIEIIPEFALMSRRPGIGHDFYRKFESDWRNHDYGIFNGYKVPVPKYYDKIYDREQPGQLEAVKETRRAKARERRHENTPERLAVREYVHQAKIRHNTERKGLR